MNFTVVWKGIAEDDLADIWLKAVDRQIIVSTAIRMDSLLKSDPLDCGESRSGNLRVGFVYPLGFDFEVVPDNRTVFVLAIWRIDRR